jgi:hypothetical protein
MASSPVLSLAHFNGSTRRAISELLDLWQQRAWQDSRYALDLAQVLAQRDLTPKRTAALAPSTFLARNGITRRELEDALAAFVEQSARERRRRRRVLGAKADPPRP